MTENVIEIDRLYAYEPSQQPEQFYYVLNNCGFWTSLQTF